MEDEKYTNVILKDVNGKLDLLIELFQPLSLLPVEVAEIKQDVREVKSDVKVIKQVISDHSVSLSSHESRLVKLESA